MNTIIVSFEGPRGAGKTSNIQIAKKQLESRGLITAVVRLYENDVSRKKLLMRTAKYIKENNITDCSKDDYTMLMQAIGLRMAYDEFVLPHLGCVDVILLDRYIDTYMIDFQYYTPAREILEAFPKCDISFLLDISYEESIRRIISRARNPLTEKCKEEQKKRIVFQESLKKTGKYAVINVEASIEKVSGEIVKRIEDCFIKRNQLDRKVLFLGYYSDTCLSKMRYYANKVVCITSPNEKEIMTQIVDSEVVVIRSPFKITDEMMDLADKLSLIIRAGSGTDGISLKYHSKNIELHTIMKNHYSVAELAIGHAINAMRYISKGDHTLKEGRWLKNQLVGRTIRGKKVGIIGFGNIGRRMAVLLNAFETEIVVFDRSPQKEVKQEVLEQVNGHIVSIEEIALNSDIILISVPLNEETRNLVGLSFLSKTKSNVVIVNVSRGGVVDTEAMFCFLRDNPDAVFASDAHSEEPISVNYPLLKLDNFFGTPHIGAQTSETRGEIEREIYRILSDYDKRK